MKHLVPILLACLCLTACNTQVTESAAENDSWQMTCDTVSLIGQMEVSLQPYFSIYSLSESKGNIYVTVNAVTCLSHYGYQLGGDYHFCITPDGQLSKTSKKPKIPREGFIPLAQTKEWDVNYVDVGEWGNYLSFTGKNSEYVFDQPGYLRALFIQDLVFLTVSQSTIARITNPTSGRLMKMPKTGEWDEFRYYRNGSEGQEVLWTTDAFKIEWGDADTIIHGAFMVDKRLMLAMYIDGNTGIYAFDGKDFQLEYDLGALSLQDDYSALLNQLDHPNSLLMTFTDSNNRQGILHIKGRSIRLIYFLFPDRSLSVTQEDPTIPMIRSMLDLPTRTIAQIDSIEQVYGGVSTDEEQYYTLLSDSSYLWRTYAFNDSTGIVEYVNIKRQNINYYDFYNKEWPKWQDAVVNAFWDELSPIESDNSNFIAYRSPRFHLRLSKYFYNEILIDFIK